MISYHTRSLSSATPEAVFCFVPRALSRFTLPRQKLYAAAVRWLLESTHCLHQPHGSRLFPPARSPQIASQANWKRHSGTKSSNGNRITAALKRFRPRGRKYYMLRTSPNFSRSKLRMHGALKIHSIRTLVHGLSMKIQQEITFLLLERR